MPRPKHKSNGKELELLTATQVSSQVRHDHSLALFVDAQTLEDILFQQFTLPLDFLSNKRKKKSSFPLSVEVTVC